MVLSARGCRRSDQCAPCFWPVRLDPLPGLVEADGRQAGSAVWARTGVVREHHLMTCSWNGSCRQMASRNDVRDRDDGWVLIDSDGDPVSVAQLLADKWHTSDVRDALRDRSPTVVGCVELVGKD